VIFLHTELLMPGFKTSLSYQHQIYFARPSCYNIKAKKKFRAVKTPFERHFLRTRTCIFPFVIFTMFTKYFYFCHVLKGLFYRFVPSSLSA
jgi:hypothetical protein